MLESECQLLQEILQLLKIKWWNWSHERIIKFIDLLSNNEIDRFISIANDNSEVDKNCFVQPDS